MRAMRAAFVPHPCRGKQPAWESGLEDADTEINVLAEPHLGEPAQFQIGIAPDAHVEGTGIELVEFLLTPTDSARGEETGHGVGDGLLNVGKRLVCAVGTSKSVRSCGVQLAAYRSHVALWQYHIRVEYNQPFAFGTF